MGYIHAAGPRRAIGSESIADPGVMSSRYFRGDIFCGLSSSSAYHEDANCHQGSVARLTDSSTGCGINPQAKQKH